MKKLITLLVFAATVATAQDNPTALPFKELLKVIPSEIDGFTVTGEPDGMNMTMGGMSYSSAKKDFAKGEQTLEVTVNDFIGYASMYQASFGMAEGFTFEDSNTKTYYKIVDGIKMLVSVDKSEKASSIIAGYKDRYLIIIEVSGVSNEDIATAAFKKINLDELP